MARLDIDAYRKLVLDEVEDCFLSTRDASGDYSMYSFYQALRSEMNRADPMTGLIEFSDDYCHALDEAADRIWDHMHTHKDLGLGAAH